MCVGGGGGRGQVFSLYNCCSCDLGEGGGLLSLL